METETALVVAAGVQALAAIAIAVLTAVNVRLARRVAKANDVMAAANKAVIGEMRRDRETFQRQVSGEAARHLGSALIEVNRIMSGGSRNHGIQEAAYDAFEVWLPAYFVDGDAIRDPKLRDEVHRFTKLLQVVAYDWETVRMIVVEDRGDRVGSPVHRLSESTVILKEKLSAHRRGEPIDPPVLPHPDRAREALELPPTETERFFQMADAPEPPGSFEEV